MKTEHKDDTLKITINEYTVLVECPYCHHKRHVAINPDDLSWVGEKIEDLLWPNECGHCRKKYWMDYKGKSGSSVYDWDDE